MKIVKGPERPQRDSESYEVIPVPQTLRRKALVVEGSLEEALAAAVSRADAAVGRLSGEFDDWMAQEANRLVAVHRAYKQMPDSETRSALFKVAHDLRGQAALFGYPLVGQICGNLARLTGARAKVPDALVDQHVGAVSAMVRERAKDANDRLGATLAAELERLTREALARKTR